MPILDLLNRGSETYLLISIKLVLGKVAKFFDLWSEIMERGKERIDLLVLLVVFVVVWFDVSWLF